MQRNIKSTFSSLNLGFYGMLCTLFLTSCQPKKADQNESVFYSVDDTSQSIIDSLEVELNDLYELGHITGFSVTILTKASVLYAGGYGFADVAKEKPYQANTIQNIASISKTLIGLSLLKAQEEKLIDLDDDINLHLPFKVLNPHYPDKPITIRHLAGHTSTILDTDYYGRESYILAQGEDASQYIIADDDQQFKSFEERESLDDFLKNLLSEEGKWYEETNYIDSEPGSVYEYSNVGATLAAYIVQQVSGISFPEFTKRYILSPLGMTSSGWSFDEVDMTKHTRMYSTRDTLLPRYFLVTYPDGGFITSSLDLGKYLQELLRGKLGQGSILSKESYEEIFTAQFPDVKNLDGEEEVPSGIFMDLQDNGLIGHTGGDPGVVSYMFFDPESELGRILIINTSITTQACYDQFRSIWDSLKKYGLRLNQ